MRLGPLTREIEQFKNDAGFELIAQKLGIPMPTKMHGVACADDDMQ